MSVIKGILAGFATLFGIYWVAILINAAMDRRTFGFGFGELILLAVAIGVGSAVTRWDRRRKAGATQQQATPV